MRALRLILTQNKAHYRKEESDTNKLTYPLPPFSTVIGAIHNACGFSEYHEMNLSIQGSFSSLMKQAYTDYCFLNSVMDDRGMLVKLKNPNAFSAGFEKVAEAKKPTGNSFKKGINIDIYDQELFNEYLKLTELNDTDSKLKKSHFQSLTTSLKFYEILLEVKLIIHITSEESGLLETIKENIKNLKSIGRSEDFVDVRECEIVDLRSLEEGEEIESAIPAYINLSLVRNRDILLPNDRKGVPGSGTRYYLGKKYTKENGYREFKDKKPVLFTSRYIADQDSKNIYVDDAAEKFLVNFN